MTNKSMLLGKMKEAGINGENLAKAIGIGVVTFYRKLSTCESFTVSQVNKIKDILHLTNKEVIAIFFSK